MTSSCLDSNGIPRPSDISPKESETSLYTMPFQSPFAVNSSAFLYNNWFGTADHKASSQLFGYQGKTPPSTPHLDFCFRFWSLRNVSGSFRYISLSFRLLIILGTMFGHPVKITRYRSGRKAFKTGRMLTLSDYSNVNLPPRPCVCGRSSLKKLVGLETILKSSSRRLLLF